MPGLGEARLQRLRHVGEGRGVDHVEGDVDRGLHAGVGEDLLGLLRVIGERRVVERAGEALGPEGLVRLHLPLEDGVGHPLVVDEIARRLPDCLGLQRLDLLVEGEEVHGGLREDLDLDLVRRQPGDLVRRQVLRHVHVALLQQQLLGRGLRHVADDDAVDLGRAVEIVREGGQPHQLRRAVVLQRERPRAGGMGVHPGVAHVAVDLVGHDHRLVDDGGRARGEHVHHEGGREVALVLHRSPCCRRP